MSSIFSHNTDTLTTKLNVAQRVSATHAEGPGLRYAIWLRGCSLRCPGCCNPHLFQSQSPKSNWMGIDIITEDIKISLQQNPNLEGVSILGGEPVEQPQGLFELCRAIHQQLGLSIMVFSGYLYSDIIQNTNLRPFLEYCDILVDGPFDKNLPEDKGAQRKWIGSQNQNIHILSERYTQLDQNWPTTKNTVEIRMKNGEITINGFPFENFNFMKAHRKSR